MDNGLENNNDDNQTLNVIEFIAEKIVQRVKFWLINSNGARNVTKVTFFYEPS